eukprot:CAMPEP_0174721428 /NCGR_PEP_ID=MMETSP1094-20130205/36176_1 /TAXON_ID=156173 /ORGANISM="Chrysochromulina brevifilum, Strain UTEX LB 985" /LENGTH=95 /DNA_ID=CAMNT_0015922115 /DNA_START=429 /DNA_END=716 /DNA_ORIENTATION=-
MPAASEEGNVGTAAERLQRSGALDKSKNADPRCQSGVFVNFKQGMCTPVGNIYDRMGRESQVEQDSMDDLAAAFMAKSGIAKPAEAEEEEKDDQR